MKNSILFLAFILLFSCKSNTGKADNASETEPTSSVETSSFGQMPDGTEIELFSLQNNNGMKVGIITYGGIVQSIRVPDRHGKTGDVVLGHDNLQGYLEQNPYFGGIIGRFANRIAGGKFELDGEQYQLASNDGPNHLHGGEKGFDKVVWKGTKIKNDDGVGVRMEYLSKDGDENYPGNLNVVVEYILTDENSLDIHYSARTDQPTIVNLTNHSYFNFSEDKTTILDHILMLNASRYLPVDSTLIPVGVLASVSDTPFDFREMKMIKRDIAADDIQLGRGKGYDHCWVLRKQNRPDEMSLAARLFHPGSGRMMEIYTTEPAIQFYSGNFLDGTITGKGGKAYPFRSGLCLETQHYPDAPNHPNFPSVVLRPGEQYESTTRHIFSVEK